MAGNVSGIGTSSKVYTLTDTQLSELLKSVTDKTKQDEIKAAALNGFDANELASLGADVRATIIKIGVESMSAESSADKSNIDPVATANFRKEIELAKLKHSKTTDAAEKIECEIKSRQKTFEEAQAALGKAADQLGDKSNSISKSINESMQSIIKEAQSGKLTKEQAQQKLGSIKVPGLSSELGKIEGLQDEIGSLANILTDLSDAYAIKADTIETIANKYGDFLEIDLSTVCVDKTGKITINQAGTGGPSKSGADGISATDMAKFASMTNEELAKALETGTGKAILAAMNTAGASTGQTLSSAEGAAIIKKLIEQQKTSGTVSDKKFGSIGKGAALNSINGVDKEMLAKAGADACQAKVPPPKSCDPYEVTIDGKTYQFMKDNGDGKWDTADIFGINDSKDNIFESMKGADLNKDGQVNAEELAKMGIRLVQVENGKLQVDDTSKDFDLSKVDSINMNTLRSSNDNDGDTGTFGNFDLKLKDGRSIEGKQTFEKLSTLEKLFQGVQKFFSSLAENVINKFKLDPETVKLYTSAGKFANDSAKVNAELTKSSEELANTTVSSAEDGIDIAKSQGYGSDPKEKTEEKPKPVEQKPEDKNVKKKKPEEVQ